MNAHDEKLNPSDDENCRESTPPQLHIHEPLQEESIHHDATLEHDHPVDQRNATEQQSQQVIDQPLRGQRNRRLPSYLQDFYHQLSDSSTHFSTNHPIGNYLSTARLSSSLASFPRLLSYA
uniref:Uncharacterized protein n=1 Tax=Utricularia reniformis TaxID=192314 RepID=A0A1Y0B279_9LAMI|nr:hypothetical protein AEK19_MT1266 [Utricularia reniformis]ART31473.1 hypothetical protein AEK19_MT1266 [Utricularia reniformis]